VAAHSGGEFGSTSQTELNSNTGFVDGALIPTFFHTNFVPDLIQVNFDPSTLWDWFNFVHFAPTLGAAAVATVVNVPVIKTAVSATAITLRMGLFSTLEVQKARVKLLLAMGFFRYNDPLQQLLGAIIAAIIFVVILKWAFSSNPKMIVLPINAGKKDQYGMLKPIDAAQMKIDLSHAQEVLADFKIKATVTDTYDGVQLMVFEKDYQKAMRILGQPIEGS
jgi:hypothetical protein